VVSTGSTMANALEALRSQNLTDLFTQALGWQPVEKSPAAQQQALRILGESCCPIAYRDGVVVWQVLLSKDFQLTPASKAQIYQSVLAVSTQATSAQTTSVQTTSAQTTSAQTTSAQTTSAQATSAQAGLAQASEQTKLPLVIFVDAAKTRSLWCQSLQESALYVVGQPTTLWRYRLQRFSQSACGLFPTAKTKTIDAKYAVFEQLIQGLYDHISGVSNSTDRQRYAVLTLQRLIFVQSIQIKGWLNGESWYLQTRFETALQQGENLFFTTCLQPLYQSLALPALERPLSLVQTVGSTPFLGHLFGLHPLEQRYADINIADRPFEAILGWMSEQTSAGSFNPWLSADLGSWLERYWASRTQPDAGYVGDFELASRLCDRTLDPLLSQRISNSPNTETAQLISHSSLNERLFQATPNTCRQLIQEILPTLRVLDPACGSGNLLAAINQRLLDIFSVLTGYTQQSQDAQLKIWQSSLLDQNYLDQNYSDQNYSTANNSEPTHQRLTRQEKATQRQLISETNILINLQIRVFKNNLYGVDLSAGAVESAHFLLLLHLVTLAQVAEQIEPLFDLSFNVMSGNSLVGLIDVDEESFDQIDGGDGQLNAFQGNLLQPLAAEGYQTILAEKNLALEHYKSRNQLLADARNIPAYARASLLRSEITQLDNKAQNKLNALLLRQMSQQMGIQYKAMQLNDKPQRRLLTLEDIDILQPFHWGYHFNSIIRQGGFDCVVCAPPWEAFRPTAEDFFQRFQDLAEAKGMSAKTLKTSKQALAKGDPEIAEAWLFYQEQYAYVADYFYRSEHYAHQNPTVNGVIVRNQIRKERLFAEQCVSLLSANGIGAILLPQPLSAIAKAETLQQFFEENTVYVEHAEDVQEPSSRETPEQQTVLVWQMQKDALHD